MERSTRRFCRPSYEDLLGITRGGTAGFGHLGLAAAPGLAPFGRDVFNARELGRWGY